MKTRQYQNMEFPPPAGHVRRLITKDEGEYIRGLWLTENDIILAAARGDITEAERVKQLWEIRTEIYSIMYQEGKP